LKHVIFIAEHGQFGAATAAFFFPRF
jgi:hypothetical protein